MFTRIQSRFNLIILVIGITMISISPVLAESSSQHVDTNIQTFDTDQEKFCENILERIGNAPPPYDVELQKLYDARCQ